MKGGGVEEKGGCDRVGYRGGKLANEGVEGLGRRESTIG